MPDAFCDRCGCGRFVTKAFLHFVDHYDRVVDQQAQSDNQASD